MKTLTGKLALVTGAGSGIGRATALALAGERMQVIACDRDAGALGAIEAELRGRGALAGAEVVDVSDREAMRALAERVHRTAPALDVLVNNAGVAHMGRMIDTPLADWDHVLGVNLGGVIHGCHFFVPAMVRRRSGHVVNISSMVGIVALPGTIAYVTSKFAVLGLSEALRAELAPHGVGVSAICPGVIRTNIARSMRVSIGPSSGETKSVLEKYGPSFGHDPSSIARAVVRAVRKNRGTVPVTAESHALAWLKRASPRAAGLVSEAIARLSPGEAAP
jgi:NAD(P)-dependent dehydrogenase (short-subunit alcohol dehydrogenase family)